MFGTICSMCSSPSYFEENWRCRHGDPLWRINLQTTSANLTTGANGMANAFGNPDYFTLPGLSEDGLWVWVAGIRAKPDGKNQVDVDATSEGSAYWIGRNVGSSNSSSASANGAHFQPLAALPSKGPPVACRYGTGCLTGNSFWDETTKRRLMWWDSSEARQHGCCAREVGLCFFSASRCLV